MDWCFSCKANHQGNPLRESFFHKDSMCLWWWMAGFHHPRLLLHLPREKFRRMLSWTLGECYCWDHSLGSSFHFYGKEVSWFLLGTDVVNHSFRLLVLKVRYKVSYSYICTLMQLPDETSTEKATPLTCKPSTDHSPRPVFVAAPTPYCTLITLQAYTGPLLHG